MTPTKKTARLDFRIPAAMTSNLLLQGYYTSFSCLVKTNKIIKTVRLTLNYVKM